MPQLLLAERAAQHRAKALPKGRLVDVELVGIDLALDDVLAEAIGAGDEHHVAEAGFGVEREDHAAAARSERTIFITPTDSADLEVIEAVVDPIDDRAIGEHRGEARRQASNRSSAPRH
jgi:hypothetical protein